MKFSAKDFFSKCYQIRSFPANLTTFIKEILNGKLLFFVLCSGSHNLRFDISNLRAVRCKLVSYRVCHYLYLTEALLEFFIE